MPSRHNMMLRPTMDLMALGTDGEPGVAFALRELKKAFVERAANDRAGGEFTAEAEFDRMFTGAGDYLEEQGASAVEEFLASVPIPLAGDTTLPAFPTGALPDVGAAMVEEVARSTQTDPAMAGTCALSAYATACGGAAEIEIENGWREGLNLYTAPVAESGERKSAVHRAMTRAIFEVEQQIVADARPARAEAESLRQVIAKELEQAIRRAARDNNEETRREVAELTATLEAHPIPNVPRLGADDVTPEAVGSLLFDQNGRLGILSTEGGILGIIAGRYNNNTPNFDIWLKGHSGDPVRIDRKGRPPEFIPKPALTLCLMIQPDVLLDLAAHRSMRGRGLVARFLYAMPRSYVGYRDVNAAALPVEVQSAYDSHLSDLVRGMHEWVSDPAVLTLTKKARKALRIVAEEVEPLLREDGQLAALKDWGSKYVGAVARIAGIIHLAELGPQDGPKRPVGEDTVWKAADLGTYFKFAAIAAFRAMGTDPANADALYLLGRIRNSDVISERDMHRLCQSRFAKKSALVSAIAVLVDHGYLRPLTARQQKTKGRPASPVFKVHPAAKTPTTTAHAPSYPPPRPVASVITVTDSGRDSKNSTVEKEEEQEDLEQDGEKVEFLPDSMTEHTETPSCPPDHPQEAASVITVTDSGRNSKNETVEAPPVEAPAQPMSPEDVAARFAAIRTNMGVTPNGADGRIEGVLTRRLRKVGQATRSELRVALNSPDRPLFPPVFDRLVEEGRLIPADPNRYRLAEAS